MMVEHWCLQRKLQAESYKDGPFSANSKMILKYCHELFPNKTFKRERINSFYCSHYFTVIGIVVSACKHCEYYYLIELSPAVFFQNNSCNYFQNF